MSIQAINKQSNQLNSKEALLVYEKKAKRDRIITNIVLYTILVLLAIILLVPYVFMISKSLMTPVEVTDPRVVIIPKIPQFSNYRELFAEGEYLRSTGNTLIVEVFNLIAIPLSASIVAFSFAKLRWFGREFMFAVMMGTMMLPAIVTQLPLYMIFTKLHWIDTLYPFTIPNLFGGGAVFIFLLRQFMMGIPKTIDDAAKIDGASAFRRYWNIMLPLCKPVLIYVMVNTFITYWGDYYGPLLYMHSSDAPRTLAYTLFVHSTEDASATDKAAIRMAGGVFMSIIPGILFGVFQRQLIDGVIMTGIKD